MILSVLSLFSTQAYAVNSEDWDNDGLSDQTEEIIGTEVYLADTDGDGIPDMKEVGNISNPLDSDNDGRIDALDVDDDNDGIPTVIEGASDSDRDGKPNYLDTDSDGDGLVDGLEVQLTGKDSNYDGVDDRFDASATRGKDDNGDGIDDDVTLIDSNKNGISDLLDNKSTIPHIAHHSRPSQLSRRSQPLQQRVISKTIVSSPNVQEKTPEKNINIKQAEKKGTNPVVISATQLPVVKAIKSEVAKPTPKPAHKYTLDSKESKNKQTTYGGSGYFYCGNNGRIVTGIKGFAMTPPSKVTLLRDASKGDYKWSAEGSGTYALQFQIPQGMSIVRGLAKGRRIVKSGDINPLVLGAKKNPAKKGYLDLVAGSASSWYTSFDLKDNAPLVTNNNIPLSGGVCGK